MTGSFTLDYVVFTFLAALGLFQMIASYSGLRGLLFIRARSLAFLSGLLTTAVAFLWFFLSEPRNVPDTQGGLDGNETAGLFTLGAVTALVLTLLLSSLRNRSMGKNGREHEEGLNALRDTTYVTALQDAVRSLWIRFGL